MRYYIVWEQGISSMSYFQKLCFGKRRSRMYFTDNKRSATFFKYRRSAEKSLNTLHNYIRSSLSKFDDANVYIIEEVID